MKTIPKSKSDRSAKRNIVSGSNFHLGSRLIAKSLIQVHCYSEVDFSSIIDRWRYAQAIDLFYDQAVTSRIRSASSCSRVFATAASVALGPIGTVIVMVLPPSGRGMTRMYAPPCLP